MKNIQIQSILAEIAEQAVPSAQIDLWHGMRHHLVTSESRFQQGVASMKTYFSRTLTLYRIVLTMLTIVVAFGIVLATPQGRAFAQSILQFFIRINGNTIPATPRSATGEPKWVDVPGLPPATMTPFPALAAFAADCGDFPRPTCTIEQIRSKVNFTVKELGSIPRELYFIGATGGPSSIQILYEEDAQNKNPAYEKNNLRIFVERWAGQPASGSSEVAASAVVEKVQIGSLPGEYYKGGFYQIGKETVTRWNSHLWTETLRWVENNVSYTLKYSFNDGIYLGKQEMVALAENMTSQPVASLRPMPTPTQTIYHPSHRFNLSIPQAEQQAGFKVSLITRLPEFPPFIGALYDPDHKIVRVIYFFENTEASQISIFLNQQIASNPDGCWLCSFFVGDNNRPAELDPLHRMVPPSSKLQTVQIDALTGQYIEGFWYKPAQECCYIWEPHGGYRTLRWWKNGMAFELVNTGLRINQADMLTIAESIK